MMQMRTKPTAPSPFNGSATATAAGDDEGAWEMRPGGMLVQTRIDSEKDRVAPPTIRVRVKYGSVYHQVNISSQATFGELKKLLRGPTGLHHLDQKLFFKDKEKDNNSFLDIVGVKDKSKLVVTEDPISQEKRYIEMRKNEKMEKSSKSISGISLEIDRLAGQVSALESVISKGARVPEKNIVNVIEQLMNQLLKLDAITADGDVKLQRKMQVRRVQKYVETLDVLKMKNSMPSKDDDEEANENRQPESHRYSTGAVATPPKTEHRQTRRSIGHSPLKPTPNQPQRNSTSGPVVITTQWETFDALPPLIPIHTSTSSSSSSSESPKMAAPNSSQPLKFNWDLL
ncbi:BAG family molecular chaperone regulator 2 [Impatiens glandulifera]|uniref:BAG family molecular chaperone regulator 2 n=1 Tax=Impatiens glandulifera TaxID=253017 RepID=UPI001FB0BFA6|nr:BAG family molecular chaperone regulator 2 [Impatiens glandulifera]